MVVVRDPGTRLALRDLYVAGWYEYLAQAGQGLVPWAPVTDDDAEIRALAGAAETAAQAAERPGGFAEHLHTVPVLLLVVVDLRVLAAVDKGFTRYTFAGGASLYPFVWSVLLAARAEGLGGVMTTVAIRREPEVRELFGLPPRWR